MDSTLTSYGVPVCASETFQEDGIIPQEAESMASATNCVNMHAINALCSHITNDSVELIRKGLSPHSLKAKVMGGILLRKRAILGVLSFYYAGKLPDVVNLRKWSVVCYYVQKASHECTDNELFEQALDMYSRPLTMQQLIECDLVYENCKQLFRDLKINTSRPRGELCMDAFAIDLYLQHMGIFTTISGLCMSDIEPEYAERYRAKILWFCSGFDNTSVCMDDIHYRISKLDFEKGLPHVRDLRNWRSICDAVNSDTSLPRSASFQLEFTRAIAAYRDQ